MAACQFNPNPNAGGCNVGYWQSGIYLEHVPTGLFVYGAYGREFLNTFAGFNSQPDHWMVKGGVRELGTRSVTRSSTAPMPA